MGVDYDAFVTSSGRVCDDSANGNSVFSIHFPGIHHPQYRLMSDVLALTQALIRRPSVSPDDQGCQDILATRLAEAGFTIEWMPFGDVLNVWATRGTAGPTLCVAGHTDVVPTGPLEGWQSDPFDPVVREGVLFGRGAADMKSGLAAMVVAVETFLKHTPNHRGRIAFLITADEEGRSIDGTKRVVEALMARGETIDWCVIGEPSSEEAFGDTIKIGRRGSLSGRLTVHGVQGHIAYPQLADNPIHRFAPVLAELCGRHWDHGNAHFEPTSFQVGNLNAGTGAPNVIPGELVARFNLRFCPEQTVAGLQAAVTEVLDRHALRYTLEWFVSGLPFYTPPGMLSRAAVKALHAVTGRDPKLSTGCGTSDGRFIAQMGTQIVELGVVNRTIHKINEQVSVKEIYLLTETYEKILTEILG
jgi:succinyl-diaminopimelate desuccinylase